MMTSSGDSRTRRTRRQMTAPLDFLGASWVRGLFLTVTILEPSVDVSKRSLSLRAWLWMASIRVRRGSPVKDRHRTKSLSMNTGSLKTAPARGRPDLLAPSVLAALAAWDAPMSTDDVLVAEIDPELADTRAFCERYDVPLDRSANCVILSARREGRAWFAACVVLATTRADVNGLAKRYLGASKISFAAMEDATAATAMEYGGITPIGLPADWPLLIDERVAAADRVVVGSGLRRSKIVISGQALARLPNAAVLAALGRGP